MDRDRDWNSPQSSTSECSVLQRRPGQTVHAADSVQATLGRRPFPPTRHLRKNQVMVRCTTARLPGSWAVSEITAAALRPIRLPLLRAWRRPDIGCRAAEVHPISPSNISVPDVKSPCLGLSDAIFSVLQPRSPNRNTV